MQEQRHGSRWSAKDSAKRVFVVGRRTRKATAVVLVGRRPAPVRGPWTLQAVVSAN